MTAPSTATENPSALALDFNLNGDPLHDALQGACNAATQDRPGVGAHVTVKDGKHAGIVGRVTWHGKDRFSRAGHYGNWMTAALRDARGTYGFRVRIQPDGGGEPFFIGAERVDLVKGA